MHSVHAVKKQVFHLKNPTQSGAPGRHMYETRLQGFLQFCLCFAKSSSVPSSQ